MLIFWWQGKGYWTLLLLFLVGMAGTLLLQGARSGTEGPWFAAGVLAITAVWNWEVGSRWNGAERRRRPIRNAWDRLTYRRAPNRFLSLPMESMSVVMAAGSALLLLRGVAG